MSAEPPAGSSTSHWPHAEEAEPLDTGSESYLKWNPYQQDPYYPDPYAPR
jgi:hypothetical protein